MRRVLILVLLVAFSLSAELWVNAIRDPGAELGLGDWDTDVWENQVGSADSARVDVHDSSRAFEGEFSFLTDTEKDPINHPAGCYVYCYQFLAVPKAVADIDSCFWVMDVEKGFTLTMASIVITFRSRDGKNIRWLTGVDDPIFNDTLFTVQFPLPDSGVWTEYEDNLNSRWVGSAGWSSLDTIVEIQLRSWGAWVGSLWYGQEVSWDNIVLQSIAYYDYTTQSIDSDAAANEQYTPVATFVNEGILNDKDGVVYAEVLDGETRVYIDSQSVSIPAESSEQVTFREWTVPHDGSYTLRVYPILELDEYSEDDTLEMVLTGEGIEEAPLQAELVRTSYNSIGVLFSFPSGTNGQLSIYDASGREVYTASIVSGTPELLWSTIEVSSGLYFYRFNSEGLSVTNKLIVLH